MGKTIVLAEKQKKSKPRVAIPRSRTSWQNGWQTRRKRNSQPLRLLGNWSRGAKPADSGSSLQEEGRPSSNTWCKE